MDEIQFATPQVFILGNGGFAKELKVYYEQCGTVIPTLIGQEDMEFYHDTANKFKIATILGSGKPEIKERMLKEARGKFASLLHPRASICSSVIGEGTVIAPGAVIAPHASIGKHVLVNYNATIGHDTVVGDLSVVSPNAAVGGNCVLGRGVYVGSGASIKEQLTIADGVTIGMGAVVTKDILEPGITVVGVPARKLEKE